MNRKKCVNAIMNLSSDQKSTKVTTALSVFCLMLDVLIASIFFHLFAFVMSYCHLDVLLTAKSDSVFCSLFGMPNKCFQRTFGQLFSLLTTKFLFSKAYYCDTIQLNREIWSTF